MSAQTHPSGKTWRPLAHVELSLAQGLEVSGAFTGALVVVYLLAWTSGVEDSMAWGMALASAVVAGIAYGYRLARKRGMRRRDAFYLAMLGSLLYRFVRWLSMPRCPKADDVA